MKVIRRFQLAFAGLGLALLVSCGGGNDGDANRYHSVGMSGGLVDYTVDTTGLTYKYTITESQIGLAGSTGNGTLTSNPDGSYTPSGAPDARVIILPNGLVLGAVRENFGAGVVTMPIIGLHHTLMSSAPLAGDYNYVLRGCASGACQVSHGTFRIDRYGAWRSCRESNVAGGACNSAATGTLEPRGGGLWRVKSDDGTDIGTAMGFNSAEQHLLIVDLKDRRAGGIGIGMLVGGQQLEMSSTWTDGSWIAATGSGHWFVFTASASEIAISQIDWVSVNLGVTFTANDPWTGMTTTAWGDAGFMAGAGVYMLKTADGDVELGVKLD